MYWTNPIYKMLMLQNNIGSLPSSKVIISLDVGCLKTYSQFAMVDGITRSGLWHFLICTKVLL